MQTVILVVHILACLAMIGVIMLQRSEGGALGIGGGSGGGLVSGRGAAGALVRATMMFGGLFFLTSLGLATLANRDSADEAPPESVLEQQFDGSGVDRNLDPLEGDLFGSDAPAPSGDPLEAGEPTETPGADSSPVDPLAEPETGQSPDTPAEPPADDVGEPTPQ